MIDDTRERFLREIAAQVPADRIAELHLFRPLRRGGTETGVAVIAVEQEQPEQTRAAAHDAVVTRSGAAADSGDAVEVHGVADPDAAEADPAPAVQAADDNPYADDVDARSPDADVELAHEPVAHADVADDGADDATARGDAPSERAEPAQQLADVAEMRPQAGADVDSSPGDTDDSGAGARLRESDAPVTCAVPPVENADVSLAGPRRARLVRHTVFTARYRLTRKGADRGKWEFEVVADADAPLGTVDMVVRGVQRRAGDDEEPERLTAEGVRAALDGLAWQRTT